MWQEPTKPGQTQGGGYQGAQPQQGGGYPGAQPQGGGYPGAQPYQQPQGFGGSPGGYPGAEPVLGAAMAGQAAPCSLTRQQLDTYLRQSGFGQNQAMFNCYFTRVDTGAPPLCIACRQPVGAHADNGGWQSGNNAPGTVDPSLALAAGLLAAATGAGLEGRQPSNLVVGDRCDTATVKGNIGLIIAGCIMLFVGAIQAIVFGAVMPGSAKFALIAPVIVGSIGLLFLAMVKRTTLRFMKDGSQTVEVERMSYLFFCFPNKHRTTMRDFGPVNNKPTNTRINRQRVHEVTSMVQGVGEVALYRGYALDCAQEAANWRMYLRQG